MKLMSDGQKTNKVIYVRMTENEKERIKAMLKGSGMSGWARSVLMAEVEKNENRGD